MTAPAITHATAERLRHMLSALQADIIFDNDIPIARREILVESLSLRGFGLVDDLEGLVR